MSPVRLQKFMAKCGVASRRACEELMLRGRVKLNGEIVTQLGTKCDPEKDIVEVDGSVITPPPEFIWIALNKPAGCLTTVSDPFGRPTVMDYVSVVEERVYPVGRLDYDTGGLLLLTNDGELAHELIHPSRGVGKVYDAVVEGLPDTAGLRRLENGVLLDDGMTSPARVRCAESLGTNSCQIRLEIHEGRKRQIRRMFAAIGHPVIKLTRIAVGPIALGDLPAGGWRYLSEAEVAALRRAVAGSGVEAGSR